ncbi:MAG: hypothetical protein J7J78_04745 [Thermoprotei archaeon]|nr:hypothetical protein [Thermoprotei archaeon]
MERAGGGVQEEGVALVLDSNILFTIIIAGKRSKAYHVIVKYELDLFMPEVALLKFHRLVEKLRRHAVKDFETKVMLAFMLVHVVPRELYEDKLRDAYTIAGRFDPKDTPFIALSLKLSVPIWTEDKDIIKYGIQTRRYIALDTIAVEKLLSGKSLENVLQDLALRLK